MTSRTTTIMIVAPTNRGHEPAAELDAAVEHLQTELLPAHVQVALLGGNATTISDALDQALAQLTTKVIIVSAQTVIDRSFDAWCRRVVGYWIRANNPPFPVFLAPPISRQPGYLNALKESVQRADTLITHKTAPLLSPAWETVPDFNRHVLVCRGPRCSAMGAGDLAQTLNEELHHRAISEDDVLVTHTGCLFPCNQGPVLAVYPDNTWYARLTPDDVPRLVDQHLTGGQPLAELLAPRSRSEP